MTKNLVIVESPAKSKTIEKFLGSSYTVRASMGHLRDLPKSSFGVNLDNDFEPKYINIRGKGDLIKELKNAAKKADKVFIATDPDREGEAIAWHLAHILGVDPNTNCRIEFHEITPDAVKNALKHPRAIDVDMVDAQQTRRIIDRIVGYKLSPLLWRKICKRLSAGRVQTATTKLICDREKDISSFVPEEYWTIKAKLAQKENSKAHPFEANVKKYKNKELKLHNADEAAKVEADLRIADYSVKEVQQTEKKQNPAAPYTTSSLQQDAVKRLNFSTKKTMMIAQQLYEGVNIGKGGHVGIITYMRTDSVRLSDVALTDIRSYINTEFGKEYLPAKPVVYKSKKNAQDAHEAIRPTSIERTPESLAQFLSRDQLRLYTIVWKRALASQMKSAVYDVTSLLIEAGDYQLNASGKILKFDGFLRLSDRKEIKDASEQLVPPLPAKTPLVLRELMNAEQHFTEPPAHYTEATLVKEMEDLGIGRPSTYSTTIQTIMSRGYIAKDGKKLLATDLGMMVVAMLISYFEPVINIPFTAELETDLDEIAENDVSKLEVLNKFYQPFAELLQKAETEIPAVTPPVQVSDVKCDKCGLLMVYKIGKYGKFLACPGFPKCHNTKAIVVKLGIVCPVCGGDIVEKKTRTGKPFYGCSNYPKCEFTSWEKPTNEKCPECGGLLFEKVDRLDNKSLVCLNQACSKCVKTYKGKGVKRGANKK